MFNRIKILLSKIDDIYVYCAMQNIRRNKEVREFVNQYNKKNKTNFTIDSNLNIMNKWKWNIIYFWSLGDTFLEISQILDNYKWGNKKLGSNK